LSCEAERDDNAVRVGSTKANGIEGFAMMKDSVSFANFVNMSDSQSFYADFLMKFGRRNFVEDFVFLDLENFGRFDFVNCC
jgi:hypothetical protein